MTDVRGRNVIGVSHTVHGSSAALLKDGRFVAAAPEERFTRIKFDPRFPDRSLRFCLDEGDLALTDVDAFAYFMSAANFVRIPNQAQSERLRFYPEAYYSLPNNILPRLSDADGYDEYVAQTFTGGDHERRFFYVDHHTAHAAHAFYASPFDEAAIITLDGRGDGVCGSIGRGRADRIELLRRIPFPHSIGQFYSAFTEFAGFRANSDEYKLMGLAAYGDPSRYYDRARSLIRFLEEGSVELDLSAFAFFYASRHRSTPKFVAMFGEPRREGEDFFGRFADVAAACQRVTEEAVVHVARAAHDLTGLRTLCYSGGVALNSLANRLLLENTGFERLYIPADPSDTGSAFGVAAFVNSHVFGARRSEPLLHDHHGPGVEARAIDEALVANGLAHKRVQRPAAAAARAIADGKVIGWFQGRMEFGPRALGARSILADPRRADMKDIVNLKIKFREPYRPFAPSVTAEAAASYFDGVPAHPETGSPTDFMIQVALVRNEWRARLPAVTHADGTGRLQTVHRETSPLYWELLTEFEKLTGVPIVLNTSFNVKDEPIVLSAVDAVRCFVSSGLDMLFCGDRVLEKQRID